MTTKTQTAGETKVNAAKTKAAPTRNKATVKAIRAEREKYHERRTEAYGRAAARVAVSLP